jgi:RNA polymerase sigma-32 factor
MERARQRNSGTRYFDAVRRSPLLQAQQEYVLAKDWRERRDRAAAHRLITSHLRLVVRIAADFRGYGFPLPEMIAEGNLGLMQAVDRFDPERGVRFATYAAWWIKARIQEYILRTWSMVRIGTTTSQKRLFFKLGKIKRQIGAFSDGDLRPDQVELIAKTLGVNGQDVVDMDRRLKGDTSLNAPTHDDGEGSDRQDWLMDDAPGPERILVEQDEGNRRHRALTGALDDLNARERRIFVARQLAEDPIGLDALACEFGVSHERVRQIEHRAFQKVRSGVISRVAAVAAKECGRPSMPACTAIPFRFQRQ